MSYEIYPVNLLKNKAKGGFGKLETSAEA